MKKNILILCALGFMMSCSGTTPKAASDDEMKEQIQAIELSNHNLEATIDSLELEVETLQEEIDQLLNDI